MGTKDKRIDDYISKSADFAKPILNHLRQLVHEGCAEVEETIKWGMPFFYYKGPLCNLASFKQHCAFGFWKSAVMKDSEELKSKNESAMGNIGKITSVADLPPDKKILGWIKEAKKLNDDEVKTERKKNDKKEIEIPVEFQTALNKNKKASSAFTSFSPSHKYEYLEWITEAKTEATRNKRIATTIEWLNEGKSRNWKYERK